MKIRVNAQEASKLFEFDLLHDLDGSTLEPQTDRDGATKLVDGVPVYRVDLAASDREADRSVQNVSVKVKNKPGKIAKGFDVKLAGQVIITPYVTSGNRQGFSIVADGIEQPVK